MAKHGEGQAGVTLIELLVSMIILFIITSMLITGWITLQSSYAQSVKANDARSGTRDALSPHRQRAPRRPAALADAGGPGGVHLRAAHGCAASTRRTTSRARPPTAAARGTLRLTRIYLDTSTGTLYWQRDTNNDGIFDRTVVLLGPTVNQPNLSWTVVNNSVANTGVTPTTTYTAIFTYGYRDASGNYQTADTIASADLATIISVNIHLIVNVRNSPTRVDLQTLVRPRNAPQS